MLQVILDELSSLLVYLHLPLRLSRTVHTYMQNRGLELTLSTRHFTASSVLQVKQQRCCNDAAFLMVHNNELAFVIADIHLK